MTPHEAARRLDRVATEYMLRWMRRLPGVTVTSFGEAEATRAPAATDLDFMNTVHRLDPRDTDRVRAIFAHYREARVRPWFELMPDSEFGRLADALHAGGARHVGSLVLLQRELPAPPPGPLPAGVAVEEVGPDSEEFARVLPAGHGVPDEALAGAVAAARQQARVEGSRRYVAAVDGRPAAAAVLFLVEGIAYLANASTLEPFRRRGCQGALIRRRLADAAAAGHRRACVLTGWGSQSHANLARAGFGAVCTKAIWRVDW
ncbi:MAG TPA: hypothetical protein VLW53_05080 [Candidatus Eisenbacteria bacterium]|nr:hypothetical protein [Candidatus Eisenbacteria bacterium]